MNSQQALPPPSDEFESPCHPQRKNHKHGNGTDDAKEPAQPIRLLTGNVHIHPEETTDQIQRHEDGSQHGDLAEHLVGPIARGDGVDADLGKVIAVRAREHLVEVAQIAHHGDDVILDITQVETDVATGRDAVLLVAALGEALDDIGLASEKPRQGRDRFAAVADLAKEIRKIVVARYVDLVLNGVGFDLDVVDGRTKCVHDIITESETLAASLMTIEVVIWLTSLRSRSSQS